MSPTPTLLVLLPQAGMREPLLKLLAGHLPQVRTIGAADAAEALPHVADVDAIVTFSGSLTAPLLQQASRLRWVHSFGTGVDGIADHPALASEVLVTATRGVHGASMSEMAFLLMLALSRDLPRNLRNQAARRWERWPAALLDRKQVGILGVGAIAQELAPRCKAFGMFVTGISRTPRALPGFDRMVDHAHMLDALGELDYLVLTVPYSPETLNLVDAGFLARMKPGAFLVNLARGGIVDEQALVQALRERRIAGAGIDVFSVEPLPAESPLWELPNVILTAHQGGMADRYVGDAFPILAHNLRAFLDQDSGRMQYLVRR